MQRAALGNYEKIMRILRVIKIDQHEYLFVRV